jgi:hypothetical protein
MKKLLILICSILFFVGCKDKSESQHSEKHTSFVSFVVTNGGSIGSYNLYLNDNIVGQFNGTGTDSAFKYSFTHDGINQHPMTMNYMLEPKFYDSSSSSNISLYLTVDEQIVAETPEHLVKFDEVVNLSHTVE